MHIAIFLQHYHTPDCPTAGRPHALVDRLARDHKVTLLTTRAWEEKRLTHRHDWIPAGVQLHAFDVPYRNAMSARERVRAFMRYGIQAVGRGLRIPRPDLVIGSSTPLTAAAAAALVASIRGVPWIFEVRDLWPDFPIQMGALPSPTGRRALYGLEHALYQSADHVVAASPDMARHVDVSAPETSTTTIGYGTDRSLLPDDGTAASRAPISPERSFVVLYAGALGRANDIPTILSAARRLRDRSDILVAIAGDGHLAPEVRRAAQTIPTLRYLSARSYSDALRLFTAASLSIVSFVDRPVLAANAPSKFFDSLTAGTPVVVTQDGWTRRFIERHDCGWHVPPESPAALAEVVRRCADAPDRTRAAGTNGARAARTHFDRAAHMDRYARLVERVARAAAVS